MNNKINKVNCQTKTDFSYPQFKWGIVFVLWDKVVYNTAKWDVVGNPTKKYFYAYRRIHTYIRWKE